VKKKKVQIDLRAFPAELHALLQSANIYDSSCSSEADVLYCDSGYYIKIDQKGTLEQEAALSRLFDSRGLGVSVVDYISADRDYLVTKAAEGEDLTHHLDDPQKVCVLLADALHRVHGAPVGNAPLSARLQRYRESAAGDPSGGYYDEFVRMDRFFVSSRQEAWEIMQENKSRLTEYTLIHGDACLPNLIADGGRFRCFIDFNLSGAGDRHIDLYWALWSLQFNLKTDRYTDYFLDAYGRACFEPDMLKVIAAFELFG